MKHFPSFHFTNLFHPPAGVLLLGRFASTGRILGLDVGGAVVALVTLGERDFVRLHAVGETNDAQRHHRPSERGGSRGKTAHNYREAKPGLAHTINYNRLTILHARICSRIKKLKAEGRIFTPKQPVWQRSKVHRVLRDRAYIGDIRYHDGWQPGKHEPLIDLNTFARVQKLLGDKIYKAHELTYGSELIMCGHCGRPVTGEIVVKKKTGKSYIYYRCARYTAKDHPRDRLREEEIDQQMIALFDRIKQPEVVQKWFRTALLAWSGHHHEQSRARARDVEKQMDAVRKQQERLLNLHLSAAIDEKAYNAKSVELRDQIALLTLELEAADRKKDERADLAAKVFELSQNLTKKWVTADYSEKRRLMEMICLNIVLKGKTLCIATRKPFNALVEGLCVSESGEGGIRTPETVARLQHFQCCSFSHSDTSPGIDLPRHHGCS